MAWFPILGSREPQEKLQKLDARCCGCRRICFFRGSIGFPQERRGRGGTQAIQPARTIVSCSPTPWSRPVPDSHPVFKHRGVNKALCFPCQPGSYKHLFWNSPQTTFDLGTEYRLAPWLPGKSLSLSCEELLFQAQGNCL